MISKNDRPPRSCPWPGPCVVVTVCHQPWRLQRAVWTPGALMCGLRFQEGYHDAPGLGFGRCSQRGLEAQETLNLAGSSISTWHYRAKPRPKGQPTLTPPVESSTSPWRQPWRDAARGLRPFFARHRPATAALAQAGHERGSVWALYGRDGPTAAPRLPPWQPRASMAEIFAQSRERKRSTSCCRPGGQDHLKGRLPDRPPRFVCDLRSAHRRVRAI